MDPDNSNLSVFKIEKYEWSQPSGLKRYSWSASRYTLTPDNCEQLAPEALFQLISIDSLSINLAVMYSSVYMPR